MFTLRIVRHDREQVLAECQSTVAPARAEVLQLETLNESGEKVGPSTMWRVVSVTVHVPSLRSSAPEHGGHLSVRLVEVEVLPDMTLAPRYAQEAAILSESRM